MVFGVVGGHIQLVLLHVVVVYKRELDFVVINLMVDNRVMVQLHKQFHALQILPVQVGVCFSIY